MKRLPLYFLPNLLVAALVGIVWLFKGTIRKSERRKVEG